MALDYLSIPGTCSIVTSRIPNLITPGPTATSVDVERVFSKGRLVLSHVRNRLSAESTRALLCLGAWSKMGLVNDEDVVEAVRLSDANESKRELESDCDDSDVL
jgi:hypothetical protein